MQINLQHKQSDIKLRVLRENSQQGVYHNYENRKLICIGITGISNTVQTLSI